MLIDKNYFKIGEKVNIKFIADNSSVHVPIKKISVELNCVITSNKGKNVYKIQLIKVRTFTVPAFQIDQ